MADHRAPGRANVRTSSTAGSPAPRDASASRVLVVRVVVAALVAAAAAAAAVVLGGATTGTTQAVTDRTAAAAPIPAAASAHVPLSARADARSVARLAASRRRAVSRDSARRVQAVRADRRLERTAEARVRARQAALAGIDASAERRSEEIARDTWVLPIAGGYRVTARFGQCSGLWSSCHTGLDLATASGTPIQSIAAGEVTQAGYDGAYGNKTVVTLDDGTELWYCHQTTIEVAVGDAVAPGQVIGTVGSTGNTTGPHLHLEVHPQAGDPADPADPAGAVDPASVLADHGVTP